MPPDLQNMCGAQALGEPAFSWPLIGYVSRSNLGSVGMPLSQVVQVEGGLPPHTVYRRGTLARWHWALSSLAEGRGRGRAGLLRSPFTKQVDNKDNSAQTEGRETSPIHWKKHTVYPHSCAHVAHSHNKTEKLNVLAEIFAWPTPWWE